MNFGIKTIQWKNKGFAFLIIEMQNIIQIKKFYVIKKALG